MSLPSLWGSPMLGMAQDPVSAPRSFSPQVLQCCLRDSGQACPQLPSVLPSHVQTLSRPQPIPSTGRCLMPKDGAVPVLPAACTLLGWQDRSWLSCLFSTDPHGQPLILQGPGSLRRVILGIFSSRERPHAS